MRYDNEIKNFLKSNLRNSENLLTFHKNTGIISNNNYFGIRLPNNSQIYLLITTQRLFYLIFTPTNKYKKEYELTDLVEINVLKKIGKLVQILFTIKSDPNPILLQFPISDLLEIKKVLPKYNNSIKFNFKLTDNRASETATQSYTRVRKRRPNYNFLFIIVVLIIGSFLLYKFFFGEKSYDLKSPEKTFKTLISSIENNDSAGMINCFSEKDEFYHVNRWINDTSSIVFHVPTLVNKDGNKLMAKYNILGAQVDKYEATLKIELVVLKEFYGSETTKIFDLKFVKVNGQWKIGNRK